MYVQSQIRGSATFGACMGPSSTVHSGRLLISITVFTWVYISTFHGKERDMANYITLYLDQWMMSVAHGVSPETRCAFSGVLAGVSAMVS